MPTTYVTDYTALTNGYFRWNAADSLGTAVTIAYTFLSGNDLPTTTELPPFVAGDTTNYVAMDSARQTATRLALDEYSSVSGVQFIEVQDASLANIQLLSNQVSGSGYSWAYGPSSYQGYSGSSFVTMTEDDTYIYDSDWVAGGWAFNLLLHELGHAMGLDHPHDGTLLDPSLDNHDNTIMSYNWSWAGNGAPDYLDRATLAPLDVDALEYLYGADTFTDLGWVTLWDEVTDTFTLTGNTGDDILIGLRADSLLNGSAGADTLYGQGGDDTLNGGGHGDRMVGGAGNDTYRVNSVYDGITEYFNQGIDLVESVITFNMENYSNNLENLSLTGSANINGTGNDGANVITGNTGRNVLKGGLGDDDIKGAVGNDTLIGGDGRDTLSGNDGRDTMSGNAGNDLLNGGNENDLLSGNDGADTLFGGAHADTLLGGNGHDSLSGGTGADSIRGADDNDILFGGDQQDTLFGDAGQDYLNGNTGDDFLNGGTGMDTLIGGIGNDTLIGGLQADELIGGRGRDVLDAGSGDDLLMGNNGDDTLEGGAGNDTLYGNSENDLLNGGSGNDILSGGGQRDTLNGGTGNDTLEGGAGADVFIFSLTVGVDVVSDWQNNVDDLDFSGLATLNSLADFYAAAHDLGSDLVITLGGGEQITVLNASEAQIDASDLIF